MIFELAYLQEPSLLAAEQVEPVVIFLLLHKKVTILFLLQGVGNFKSILKLNTDQTTVSPTYLIDNDHIKEGT